MESFFKKSVGAIIAVLFVFGTNFVTDSMVAPLRSVHFFFRCGFLELATAIAALIVLMMTIILRRKWKDYRGGAIIGSGILFFAYSFFTFLEIGTQCHT